MKSIRLFLYFVIIITIGFKSTKTFGQSLTLDWSQQISTSGWDWVNKIVPGNEQSYIIIGGLAKIINDSATQNQTGNSDAFVAMFDSLGGLVWQKSFGSNLYDNAQDAILFNNSIYVSGLYQDTIKEGNLSIGSPSYLGAYLSKISLTGNVNNIWVINNISSVSNFLTTNYDTDRIFGAYKCSELFSADSAIYYKADSNRIVIIKIDTSGIQIPGMQIQSKGNLTLSSLNYYNNKLYLTGSFSDTLNVKDSIYISSGMDDAFIICLNTDFELAWVRTYGGNGSDKLSAIDFDHQGNIILSGTFEETALFDSCVLTSEGSSDVFVLQLDSSGIVNWIRKISGLANEECYDVAINSNNDAFVLGSFRNNIKFAPFPYSPGYQEYLSESGFGNLFLSMYANNGDLKFSYALPGTSEDFGKAILIDSSDNLIIAGNFNVDVSIPNLNSDSPVASLVSNGDNDVFVAKFANPCLNMKLDIVNDSVLCQGSSRILDAGDGFESYSWSTGEDKQSITISKQGTYSVVVKNLNGCVLHDSIKIIGIPDPIVFAGNDTTIITNYFIPDNPQVINCDKYFWKCNGAGNLLYADSIHPVYFPTTNEIKGGVIEFTLTGENACNTTKSILNVRFDSGNSSFLIYPNPGIDFIKVTSLNNNEKIKSIELCMNNGSMLKKWHDVESISTTLDVSDLAPGIYQLLINSINYKENAPLIIIEDR